MEEDFLRDHPELKAFVLSDVQPTGIRIGGGSYSRVEEVAFPVGAAAKTIYAFVVSSRLWMMSLGIFVVTFVRI